MRGFNVELMRDLASTNYVTALVAQYDDDGVQRLLELVREVFKQIAPELLPAGITIIVPIDKDIPLSDGGATHLKRDLASLTPLPLVVAPYDSASVRCWFEPVDTEELTADAIVYQFDGSDHFVTPDGVIDVPVPAGFGFAFAMPVFVDLQHALDHYRTAMVLRSRCYILQSCWYDEYRLVLRNKPERTMRRSLENYLAGTLRGYESVEVRPEQVVDESHPVDLKISWSFSNRIAYIEIKWLGDSINALGTTLLKYRDRRAREGVRQLVKYLDRAKSREIGYAVRGYLVIFDARRRGLSVDTCRIPQEAARYYAHRDIDFRRRYEEERADFAKPLRMFLEPRP